MTLSFNFQTWSILIKTPERILWLVLSKPEKFIFLLPKWQSKWCSNSITKRVRRILTKRKMIDSTQYQFIFFLMADFLLIQLGITKTKLFLCVLFFRSRRIKVNFYCSHFFVVLGHTYKPPSNVWTSTAKYAGSLWQQLYVFVSQNTKGTGFFFS